MDGTCELCGETFAGWSEWWKVCGPCDDAREAVYTAQGGQ